MKTPNVLLIAYSCEPGRGSEWGTSWAFVREMAEHQPVWVLVHEDCRAALEAHLANHETPFPIHITAVALPRWLAWMRNASYALHNIHYYLWQIRAGRVARRLHRTVGFDVEQHISYSRWWMPSAGMALVRDGVKFIFGPCVGGEAVPKAFRKRGSLATKWGEVQRNIARALWRRDPMLARCIRSADIVVGGTPTSLAGMAKFRPKRLETLPAVMITDTTLIDLARPMRRGADDGTLRVVSVGGVHPARGIDLILLAIQKSGAANIHYTHCCGGPALDAMKRLAAELGIAARVTFTGETTQAQNLVHVARSDVLIHLALRDSQGVVPESLALGVPVVALDHHSMSPLIDETVGHKVNMVDATPRSVIDDVARVLTKWAGDRAALRAMAPACIERSQELSPQHRVALFRQWHAELANRRTIERLTSVRVEARLIA